MIQPDINQIIENLTAQLAGAYRDLAVTSATLTAANARLEELEPDEG